MDPQEPNNSGANSEGAAAGADGGGDQNAQAQAAAQEPKTYSEEAYRKLQSDRDRTQAELRRAQEQAEEAERKAREAEEQARRRERDAQLAALPAEQRQALIDSWKLDDQRRELDEDRKAIEGKARETAQLALAHKYGVKPEDLAGCETPAEMEAKALSMENERLKKQLDDRNNGVQQQSQQQAPATPGQPGQQGGGSAAVPAGMRANPAPQGGGGGDGFSVDKYKGTGDLAGALREMNRAGAWEETVVEGPKRGGGT